MEVYWRTRGRRDSPSPSEQVSPYGAAGSRQSHRARVLRADGVALLLGLHLSEFAVLRDSQALINQGRYLFPLISLAGLAAAAALTVIPAKARQPS